MDTRTLRFIRRGQLVTLGNVPPERTLLEVLREDLGATGTKEGCNEGDCGACTVVIGELDGAGDGIAYRAINSCIRLAHSVAGMAVWAVEDLAATDGTLHPAQQAMVQCHASQCGFCTPGFVMSLFGMYQKYIAPKLVTPRTPLRPESALAAPAGPAASAAKPPLITRELAQQELSGNLCRCTGYRPIFDAAQRMAEFPVVKVDETVLVQQLRQLRTGTGRSGSDRYLLPDTLQQLLKLRAVHPQAQLVAGCTDVGLWVTKMHMSFDSILDVTQVQELRRIEHYDNHIAIGAGATLTDAFDALAAERPQLKTFGERFAGLPVRNSGTLGGNVATGSPIGDSMPLLIALGAHLVLMSVRGYREMPLEHFYAGYRKTVLAPDEVVAWIKVPRPLAVAPVRGERLREGQEFLRAYKISKRYDDDISAVCLVLNISLQDKVVAKVAIGAGGVAPTPARANGTEAFLIGRQWTAQTALEAARVLRAEFQPISDMRASAAYRSEVLGNLMRRFWLESQGMTNVNLESMNVIPGDEPGSGPVGAGGVLISAPGRDGQPVGTA